MNPQMCQERQVLGEKSTLRLLFLSRLYNDERELIDWKRGDASMSAHGKCSCERILEESKAPTPCYRT
jgi:hypothetical protein